MKSVIIMGSIKGKTAVIKLATVADLEKMTGSAKTAYYNAISKSREAGKLFGPIAAKFAEAEEEADILIRKAKEIGADQIVKDATAKKAELAQLYKEADGLIDLFKQI